MSVDIIPIEEPVTIRQWTPGGKGGFGYRSMPCHRLARRTAAGDTTTCGVGISGSHVTVKPGPPRAADVAKYGVCLMCWPKETSR